MTATTRTTTRTATRTATQATAGLASALRPAVLRLSRRLRRMRDTSLGLGPNQVSAMGVLFAQPLPIGVLAEREGMRPPSMTKVVNALEAEGMVVREPDPNDRRCSVVRLTDAGREVIVADRRRRDAWLAVRLAELSGEERDLLRRAIPVLEKVNHP